jgi:hypothetical protein
MKRFALTFILIGIVTTLLLWKLDDGKLFDRDYATTIRARFFGAANCWQLPADIQDCHLTTAQGEF